jgi:hypothetical protein
VTGADGDEPVANAGEMGADAVAGPPAAEEQPVAAEEPRSE